MNNSLTSFRAFAVLAVFFCHAGMFNEGYLGVQAFFVLSGFLLTPILIGMKKDTSYKKYMLTFSGRRILRIFPLYFMYLLLIYLIITRVFFANGMFHPQLETFLFQLPWAATFTYNFFHASDLSTQSFFLTHFWSLATEEQFYLFWPLMIFLTPEKYYKHLLLFFIAMGPAVRAIIAYMADSQTVPALTDNIAIAIYVLPFSHMDAFAIGSYFALFKTDVSRKQVALVVFAVLATGLLTEGLTTESMRFIGVGYQPFMEDSYKYIWGYSAVNLAFAFILIGLRQRILLPWVFENRVLVYLGTVSYGIYVYHYCVLWFINSFLSGSEIDSGYNLVIMAFFATIAIASISYELVEKRFIAMKDVIFKKRVEVNPKAVS